MWYVESMLDLRIGPGRRVAPTIVRDLGSLTEEQLVLLAGERGTKATPIKELRDRHHSVARLLASGKKEWEVAAITGYGISRIAILKADPTFRELVEFYRKEVDTAYVDLHEQLAGMAKDAIIVMRERLEDAPEELSDTKLLEMIKLGADRTGHGPSSTQNVNVHVGLAEKLEAARKRVAERKMIDVTPERKSG